MPGNRVEKRTSESAPDISRPVNEKVRLSIGTSHQGGAKGPTALLTRDAECLPIRHEYEEGPG